MLARDDRSRVLACPLDGVLPTLVDLVPAASWDEREAADLFGVRFDGHEPLRPLARHPRDLEAWTTDVRGDAYRDICRLGLAPPEEAPASLKALLANYDKLVDATDTMFPESFLDTLQEFLTSNEFLATYDEDGSLVPAVDALIGLFNLIGDPMLRLSYPEEVVLKAPRDAQPGQKVRITGRSALAGQGVLELVCRRDQFKSPLAKRERFDPRDAALAEYQGVYEQALDRCYSRWALHLPQGDFEEFLRRLRAASARAKTCLDLSPWSRPLPSAPRFTKIISCCYCSARCCCTPSRLWG